ncbi:NADPH:quinone oxidoreductase family protein [Nostocoides sp. Soil756]|jgi:NADPH2:quinone reductase|uniref:NADPH:quinone oxidoreductase family protein n=1 Tax=Nostocoides sp. Soil756 TaxID=1736399 RepID=UPI0006F5C5A9|nr:NADPH:quinone oxidoreductase family protein [Tetrasphaera sp. Soil756]KRE63733.1 NADPH:quinone oxidoreductase [Tetrasphaera sp. Soil756]
MRAAQVTRLDGPEAVEVVDLPDVGEGADPATTVVVDVAAAGICFPDVLLTRGQYQMKPEPPFVPGSEVAGVVCSAPPGSEFSPGDRVAAFCVLGGFAEAVAVDPAMVFPLPQDTPWAAGAALPMNYLTCHFALRERGRLQEGETVLVHGAAGGVGTAAVQLAKAWGARVVAVVSTDAKAEVARAAGADEVVPADGFKDAVADLTSGRGVDLVVDPVGGDRLTDSLRSLAPGGRHLVIGFTAGSIPEVRVNRLLLNNVSVVGVGWGAWWTHRQGPGPAYLRTQWDELLPLLQSGAVDPVIGEVRDLDEVVAALVAVDERRATGKVLLTP